ncbi:aromatic amino acid hydroxylase [Zobellia galactanivorans]|uniref:aromatic amino acid hydroxylase n=1 Tax=Zobellia galactanivorans (strain DSM 12802 / CCUG 47099 / CIP 106680 / NCIMB 13871 / Dsij) TaxID=63186 RepID=UPI001C06D211|nr:aromatic amino acid hydroxylase [Zobellia galactanivorans]MBU3024578.1 aromatic amino acid hydroxylase [Zobellia galactanivorans]
MKYISNPVLDKLPAHLQQYIKPQDYNGYSAIDQAVWRYVMRKNVDYLSKMAHASYLEGLKKTGISIDHIPNMYGMNRILKEIGWAAVAVDGFIPPSAFMEFQAYNVLVIASDIRQLDHIEYTPAPDIIHEGAGHAPIIANPEYAEYLRRFGEIGCKAISNAKDYELYEAVRHLSIIKEAPGTPQEEIDKAEKHIEDLQNNMGEPSEIALIRNLHWWTVEYGLIGTPENPKIYGAGLLSSIGESAWCMTDKVKKIPYSIDAAYTSFDITQPQPQLFVTPDFAYLSQVLEEFANTMALRRGGLKGIQKLIESKELGTIELSTGLQISGNFDSVIEHEGKPAFFQTVGPTALSFREKELVGHSTKQHATGFGSPIGKLKGINLAIEDMSPLDLKAYNIFEGQQVSLEFEGHIKVSGQIITGTRNLQGEIILVTFKNCRVSHKDKVLFESNDELYNMAVGREIVSAFNGPADLNSFDLVTHKVSSSTIKVKADSAQSKLEQYYEQIRHFREGKNITISRHKVFEAIRDDYPNDWLLPVELYELAKENGDNDFAQEIAAHLETVKLNHPKLGHLIDDGLNLVNHKFETEKLK